MNTAVGAFFTKDMLWYLRSRVRHEMADQEKWKAPPASIDLNRQIAAALLFCETTEAGGAWLELGARDCLLIDFVTDQDAADENGHALGRPILLESFRAYARLIDPYPTAEDPDEATKVTRLDQYRKLMDPPCP